MAVRLAFVTYETPFAPCGGIAAVMGRLPGHAEKASGLPVMVITPFHHRIEKTKALQVKRVGSVDIPLDGRQIRTDVLRHDDRWPWYLLRPEDPQFFAGNRHPYDVGRNSQENASMLLRDSLLFGAATARALRLIDPEASWHLMLQDWEAATLALTLTGAGGKCRMYLTLHNSYDSPAAAPDLLRAGMDPSACPGQTVLDRALPLLERPVFTVSEQFALDLTEDILQAEILAPHLCEKLRPRLVGVNNGPFVELALNEDILADAACGKFEPLQRWKASRRQEVLDALGRLVPSENRPVWGDLGRFRKDEAPWFVMAGRDDPRQKGYDVAVEAIARFLEQGGEARFLFFPIPGDEGLAGLGFLRKLAQRFPESVLVLPFLFREGTFAVLQAATYGIMPSLYEPFGMANEFYLNGTVGIARATGGILLQIVPLQAASSFSRSVQIRSGRWHSASAHPTGILYREGDGLPSALEDWGAINAAQYDREGGSPDRLEERRAFPLFRAMAEELRLGITDAMRLYRERPGLYYRMLTGGITRIQGCFSWERAAQEYVRHLR